MAYQNDDYELLPHGELVKLREEIRQLNNSSPKGRAHSSLDKSMAELNKTIGNLFEIFKETNMELKLGDSQITSRLSKLNSLNEKLDTIIDQNEKIAEAILVVAEASEKISQKIDNSSDDFFFKDINSNSDSNKNSLFGDNNSNNDFDENLMAPNDDIDMGFPSNNGMPPPPGINANNTMPPPQAFPNNGMPNNNNMPPPPNNMPPPSNNMPPPSFNNSMDMPPPPPPNSGFGPGPAPNNNFGSPNNGPPSSQSPDKKKPWITFKK
jgi:hypothetical protein